jgi:hypothetical protein
MTEGNNDRNNAVVHPSHYSRFIIEPMTFATANELNGLEFNIIKYVCRAPYKGTQIEDLTKARRSIDMLIETAKREARIVAGENPQDVWKVIL